MRVLLAGRSGRKARGSRGHGQDRLVSGCEQRSTPGCNRHQPTAFNNRRLIRASDGSRCSPFDELQSCAESEVLKCLVELTAVTALRPSRLSLHSALRPCGWKRGASAVVHAAYSDPLFLEYARGAPTRLGLESRLLGVEAEPVLFFDIERMST